MLYLGADHGGYKLKEYLKQQLRKAGIAFTDLGAHTLNPKDDYPLIALKVAKAVAKKPEHRGILLCRSGVGVNIVANKNPGIRAVQAESVWTAKRSRRDEDTNILSLPSERLSVQGAWSIVKSWLRYPYKPLRRYQRRLRQIKAIERAKT